MADAFRQLERHFRTGGRAGLRGVGGALGPALLALEAYFLGSDIVGSDRQRGVGKEAEARAMRMGQQVFGGAPFVGELQRMREHGDLLEDLGRLREHADIFEDKLTMRLSRGLAGIVEGKEDIIERASSPGVSVLHEMHKMGVF